MKQIKYNEIMRVIRAYPSRECLPIIAEKFPDIPIRNLGSIYSQDYQKKMRKTHHIHYKPETVDSYYQRYLSAAKENKEHIILSISDDVDLSPALLARLILEKHLIQLEGSAPPRAVLTQMMRDPASVQDAMLATEINECIIFDDNYGPIVDSIKHSIGHEYEVKLYQTLDSLGLTYIGEEQMRARGYDKTPDVKLEIPIAVGDHVVNWIESKASFGDEFSHNGYLKDQYWSYWNRFGPGMVIYWFGFISELDVNADKGIILMDDFPKDIIKMDPMHTSSRAKKDASEKTE